MTKSDEMPAANLQNLPCGYHFGVEWPYPALSRHVFAAREPLRRDMRDLRIVIEWTHGATQRNFEVSEYHSVTSKMFATR